MMTRFETRNFEKANVLSTGFETFKERTFKKKPRGSTFMFLSNLHALHYLWGVHALEERAGEHRVVGMVQSECVPLHRGDQ